MDPASYRYERKPQGVALTEEGGREQQSTRTRIRPIFARAVIEPAHLLHPGAWKPQRAQSAVRRSKIKLFSIEHAAN